MKIITIVGARPQFIKAAVVSRALDGCSGVSECIVHTGQHFDTNMSAVFFDELSIPVPSHHLGIGGGTHGQNTGRMIERIEEVLLRERPDWVLVYGDTDSTLAGALAAVKLHIPVAHVEAGLRSFNRNMPEETNRILTDHCSRVLFTPTDSATAQLKSEGLAGPAIHQVGDIMYDAALYYSGVAEDKSRIVEALGLEPASYVLATVHRQENTDVRERLEAIVEGFSACPDPVLWPIHPRSRHRLQKWKLRLPERIRLVEPVSYLDMVMLQKNARVVATDSGGLQKEAYFHGVPCVTLRDETEWRELIELGVNRLAGADAEVIARFLQVDALPRPMGSNRTAPFGDGRAGESIAAFFAAH